MKKESNAPREPSLVWIFILGATGFASGFFGPMVLAPGANQGPMLGLFITGPLSFVLAIGMFLFFKLLKIPPKTERRLVWTLMAIVTFGPLLLSIIWR